jgi:mRNA interferase RelE/StbE
MIVEFDRSFVKSIDKISDKTVLGKIEKTIEKVESAVNLVSIPNLKKLSGHKTYYRIRVGDYRIGLESINDSVARFIIVAHRKEIYRFFP